MFDVGFWELVLIFGVGLLILGPERMPRVASQVGRWIGRARRTASSLRRQLEKEIASADSPPPRPKPKPLKPVNRPLPAKPEISSAAEEQRAPAKASAGEPESAPAQKKNAEQDTDEPAGGS